MLSRCLYHTAHSLLGPPPAGDPGSGHTSCLLRSSEKLPSSFSPQLGFLPSSSSHLFPPHKYTGTSCHDYSCSYMVTRTGELMRVKNSSAKEKVIFKPAEFPSPATRAVVVPQGGCRITPAATGNGRGRTCPGCHCCWVTSLSSLSDTIAGRTRSFCRKNIRWDGTCELPKAMV